MKEVRKGSVLGLAIVVLMILAFLGGALMARTKVILNSSARERDRILALNSAEAGINLTAYYLENDPSSWDSLIASHSDLQHSDLNNSYFQVRDITWLDRRTAFVRSDGYSKGARGTRKTVAVQLRMIPSGFRYALWSGETIYATGSSNVYGSMRANGTGGITVESGGSFKWSPLTKFDDVETPGLIDDHSAGSQGGIPNDYEDQLGPRTPNLPVIDYTGFRSPTLFPNARIYNVLPVDPTPGNDPFTDDDVATDPSNGIFPKIQADGSVTWYYTYSWSGKGNMNDTWTVDQFNTAFAANPTYFAPGTLPQKDYPLVNWRTGVDQNGDGTIDNYRLHISGSSSDNSITATIAIYGDTGIDSGSIMITGNPTFEPATGVAVVTHGVDFDVTGNAQIGTAANPALVYASGWSTYKSGGSVSTVGSMIVGGDGTTNPDIKITGSETNTWNVDFINKMPVNMQNLFQNPSWAAQWLSWQLL